MPVATIAAFWGGSMLFVLTPGADWAYAIASGLRHRSVVPAVGGLLSGHLIAIVVVAAEVAALLAGSPRPAISSTPLRRAAAGAPGGLPEAARRRQHWRSGRSRSHRTLGTTSRPTAAFSPTTRVGDDGGFGP
jgi:hypothetical protein